MVVKEHKLNFEYDLKAIGLTDMFDGTKADFSKISADGLYIDQAVHKAVFETSKSGIKAAAATGFALKNATAMKPEDPKIILEFNKPFLYLIRDTNTKTIWFVGSLVDPSSGDENES